MTVFYKSLRLVFGYSFVLLSSKGLTLLVSYLVALSVGDAEFGYFSLAQALFITAIVFLGFNCPAAYVRYYYSEGAAAVFRALKQLNLLLLALAIFSSLLLYDVFFEHPYYIWYSLLPLSGFLAAHVASFNSIYRCSNDLLGYAFTELGRPLLVFTSLIGFVFFNVHLSVVALYLLVLLVSLVFVVFFSGLRLRLQLFKSPSTFLSEKEVISYLMPLFLVQVMALLNNVGDRYVLSVFVTVEELGRYGKAYLVGSAVGILLDSFSQLWSPFIVRRMDRFKHDMYFKCLLIFGGAICLSLALLFFAYFVFIYELKFFAFDYIFSTIAIIVLSAFIARMGYMIFMPVLSAFSFTRVVAKLSFAAALLGVMANFTLIPLIGSVGGAIATWLSYFTVSVLSFYFVRKKIVKA